MPSAVTSNLFPFGCTRWSLWRLPQLPYPTPSLDVRGGDVGTGGPLSNMLHCSIEPKVSESDLPEFQPPATVESAAAAAESD